jgi:eukaryotic-like serine/threonine-protein kinase
MARPTDEGSEAARARAASLIGRTLSERYRIVSLVAMGGMGAIYRAEHLLMRKHVAVKVLHPEIEGFPELVARFEREAVAGAHIEHPNVATASDFGKFDGGSAFLVLGFIEGITVRELIDRGPVPPRRAAWITRQVAAGLTAVHQKGVVHRDIKPKNIMIVEDGAGGDDVVKLIDFGLAKVPVEELSALAQDADNPRRSLTQAGVVLGTLGYLAPEAALGTRSILAPADLYALGVVFYEMLSGKAPFEGTDAARVFLQHRTAPVPALRERNPDVDVPPELEQIVRRMLEKDPDARYPSAGALVAALDEALGIAPSSERGAPSVLPAAYEQPKKKSRALLWIGAVLVLAASALALRAMMKPKAIAEVPPAASTSAPAPVEAPPKPPPRAPDALERLRAAADGEASAGVGVLVDVADAEPRAFADRAVQTEAAEIVEAAASKGFPTDLAFDRLSGVLGSDGLDVLYDLTTRDRAPAAAAKARTILAKPETLARATPAMRIAWDLRRAPCQQRPNLFKRAAKEGDDRALEVLRAMQAPACTKKDACCFEKNHQLELTIADIQARLRR